MTIKEHPAAAQMEAMWRSGKRAKEIIDWLEETDWPMVKYSTLARYGQRNWSEKATATQVTQTVATSTEEVDDLVDRIEEAGGEILKVSISKKPRLEWHKVDGENVQVSREVVESRVEFVPSPSGVRLRRAEVPNINIKVSSKSKKQSNPEGFNLAASVPDMQIAGFFNHDGKMEPTQDEAAIDVAHQVMALMEHEHGLDLVVNQGDNLDFPAFSSHRSPPAYQIAEGTQYAIERYATILATQRKIAPNATIVDLPSNHVIRLTNTLIDKVPALVGIKRAGEDTPVLSISNLCKFDEYDITQPPGGYPDGKYWASDNLLFVHGESTSSTPGATARKHLRDGVSVVYGHHHHEELLRNIQETPNGPKISFAGSAGCLCRVDGVVPSARTGSDETGRLAGVQTEKWNQGIWFIWYDPEGRRDPYLEICSIYNGTAIFRGQKFESTVDKFGEKL